MTDVNDPIAITKGYNTTLISNVSGSPTPNVSWVRTAIDQVNVGRTWPLPKIDKDYKGKYTCVASNECGSHNKTTSINVQCESVHMLSVL